MISEINKETLIEQTYKNILTMIANGKLKPSAFLSHRLLAEELNVSKQPVGIALQWLENDGIVESVPRVGTRIRQVTAEDMWGMLQWRMALETRIASLACCYANSSDIDKLQKKAYKVDEMIGNPKLDLTELQQADMAFHISLAKASHCEKLKNELSKINIYYLKNMLCEAVQMTRESIPSRSAVTHSEIAAAIAKGDSRLACEMVEQHLELSSDMRRFVEWYKNSKKAS